MPTTLSPRAAHVVETLHALGGEVLDRKSGRAWTHLCDRAGISPVQYNGPLRDEVFTSGVLQCERNSRRTHRVWIDYSSPAAKALQLKAGSKPPVDAFQSRTGNVLTPQRRAVILALHALGGEVRAKVYLPRGALPATTGAVAKMEADSLISRTVVGKQTRRVTLNYNHAQVLRTLREAGIEWPPPVQAPAAAADTQLEEPVISPEPEPEVVAQVVSIVRPERVPSPEHPSAAAEAPREETVIDLRQSVMSVPAAATQPLQLDPGAIGMAFLSSLAQTVGSILIQHMPQQVVEVPVEHVVERLVEVEVPGPERIVEKIVEVPAPVTLESAAAAGRAVSVSAAEERARKAERARNVEEEARKAAERRRDAAEAALREQRGLREAVERNLSAVLRNVKEYGLVDALDATQRRELDRFIREVPPGPTSRVAEAAAV